MRATPRPDAGSPTALPRLAALRGAASGKAQGPSLGRDPWTGAAVALGVALTAAVAWLSTAGAERATVRDLPPAERAAVVQRAQENLRQVCGGADRPRDFCLGQAELLLEQPECDAACRALARQQLMSDAARK
jgi:hypothetical protein